MIRKLALSRLACDAGALVQCRLLPTLTASRLVSSTSICNGLFGISRLKSPNDFPKWAEDSKDKCGELITQILAAPPDAVVVRLIDDISDEMCQVYDSAECARSVHSDPVWQQAAGQACQVLGDFIAEINHHRGLYDKLVQVQQTYEASVAAAASGNPADAQLSKQLLSQQQLSQFCPETLTVAAKYRLDFEKFGIHLSDSTKRAEVARLMALNQHYPAQFNTALADHKQLGTTAVPAQLLPREWRVYAGITGKVTVPLDSGNVHHLLSHVQNEEARKQVYMAGAATPAANLKLLDNMLSCRHQLAQLLGYKSYAAFKAADSTLAGTPEAAESFLVDLADGCKQQAQLELDTLARLKRQQTGDAAATFQPWDQDYYTRQLALGSPQHAAASAVAPYLYLSSVLAGLSQLLQQLMGLTLQQQPLGKAEGWAQGLLKYVVVCQHLGPLGTIYLDLLARPGKVPSSGILYPVRCGRELPDGGYQQPVLCLVANLSASGNKNGNLPGVQLTWREFKTLLHEMGHAVHSMVSRTKYQHVWGTRCSQDIVEVPSHLWEHFATDSRSLAVLARHKDSREPLPSQLANQLASMGSITPALELQQQALLSLVDLVYHGPSLPADVGGTSTVWAELAAEHASLQPPKGASPQARFSHLTIYGASYYSYLYARCLSEAIWKTHLINDPLCPNAGLAIRKLLLEPGGALEPLDVVTKVLGSSDSKHALQQRNGGWCPDPRMLLSG